MCLLPLPPQGFQAIQCQRVAHWMWGKGRRALALALQSRMSEVFAGGWRSYGARFFILSSGYWCIAVQRCGRRWRQAAADVQMLNRWVEEHRGVPLAHWCRPARWSGAAFVQVSFQQRRGVLGWVAACGGLQYPAYALVGSTAGNAS